jgi:hypothetical protein
MSFPLLCLINKTVVDLALNDLLIEGKISFKEWTSHRCLINGDDLLFRDLISAPGTLLPRIVGHGSAVGLVVNPDKTMVHAEEGEINSTLFRHGMKIKKINCGALFMGRDETDVIGFADRSSLTTKGFLFLVRRNLDKLKRQREKLKEGLSCERFRALVRDPTLRQALVSIPRRVPEPANPFPVVPKPVGYDLSREEEIVLIEERVSRLRSRGYIPPRIDRPETSEEYTSTLRRVTKRKPPPLDDNVLLVLAKGWEEKQKRMLRVQEPPLVYNVLYEHVCDQCSGLGSAQRLVCDIRDVKTRVWPSCHRAVKEGSALSVSCSAPSPSGFEGVFGDSDFVRLE